MFRQPDFTGPPREPPPLLQLSFRQLHQRVMEITDASVKFAGRKIPLRYPAKHNNTDEEVHPLIENSDEVDAFITAQIKTGENLMATFNLKWKDLFEDSFDMNAFRDDFQKTEQQISQLKVDVFAKIQHFENQYAEVHEEESKMLFVEISTKIQDGIQLILLEISKNIDEVLETMSNSNDSGFEELMKHVNTWAKHSAKLSIELTDFTLYVQSVEYDGIAQLKILLERTDSLKCFASFHKLVEAVGGGVLAEINKFRKPLEEYQNHLNVVLTDIQNFLQESSGLS